MYYIPSLFFAESPENHSFSCFIKPYTNTQKVERAEIWMETHVLSFLLEGEKSVILPTAKVTFRNNHFILLKKGRCLMTEQLSGTGGFRSLLVFFDNPYLLRFFKKHNLALTPTHTERSFSVLPKDELLNAIAHSLQPYFAHGKDLPASVSELKVEELLLRIVKLHGPESLSFLLDNLASYRDIEFKKIVESHVTHPLTVAQLAFLCNMSSSTFRRRFEKVYQTSPGKWFTRKRLEKAAQLLADPDTRASEIYESVGFASLSGFIHAFKQAYGLTPKQFQQG